MTDLDPAFVEQVFDVAQRNREPDLEHHRQADDLWARLEVAEQGTVAHVGRPASRPDRLKPVSSDRTAGSTA